MSRNVYVGNLPYRITDDEVRRIFAQDGREVVSINLITDRETGRPRGFGFVEMQSEAQAEAAVQALDGWMLEGRPLKVNIARPKEGGGGMGPPRRPGPPLQVDRRPPRADYGRPEGEGERRPMGDRPPYGDRPQGDRPQYGDRPQGDRPQYDRPQYGDRPQGDRPQYDRPQGNRPSYGDRPQGPSYGDRPQGPSYGDRPQGDRPQQWSDRPPGDRPSGGYGGAPRPAGSWGDRPQGDRGGYGGGGPGGPGGPGARPGWGGGPPGGGFSGAPRGGPAGRRRPEPDIDEERARKAIEWERRKGNRKKGRIDDEGDVDDTDNE